MRSLRPLFVLLALFTLPLRAAEKNIIFIIADDLSPTLGCYGDKVIKTPAIDALARDGMLFRHAFATTASCSASRSVVLSGLHNHASAQYGHQHSYHHFAAYSNVAALALPRVLQQVGYRTGHVGKFHVAPEEVFHFERYFKANGRSPVEMADAAADFLRAQDDKPFFLYYATADPHRGGGEDQTVPEKPNLFGNKPARGAFPQINEVFYQPADMVVPPFLPDTPTCRAELAQYAQSVSRFDQGVARLVAILKESGLYDKTLIVVTSDHGIAMPGGKTTVYEPGLRVPFVVRNPYAAKRGLASEALISHVDITPSLLDFAGGLDATAGAPAAFAKNPPARRQRGGDGEMDNPGPVIAKYHGRSWVPILAEEKPAGWDLIHASHTFHEIQMYYPMRVVRDRDYKLIWNIAHPLPFPFASDLWEAPTWQAQWKQGPTAPYGVRTVGAYIQRPQFELFDLRADPDERTNLATDPRHKSTLDTYIAKLKAFEKQTSDPWIMKWDYE